MSKFFVGQRVKKVRGRVNVGFTGVVVALGFFPKGPSSPGFHRADDCDIRVRFDTDWRNKEGATLPASHPAFGLASQYEPAYDGNEVVSWESCLWMPEPQQERVS